MTKIDYLIVASEEILHDYKTYYKQNYQSNKNRRAALVKDIAVLQRKIQVEV